jgi:hydrogenase maturation protein HypF
MALSYLRDAFGEEIPPVAALKKIDPKKRRTVLNMMRAGINSPPTSSCGRLFDAVSFLAGLAPAEVEFEAEAPMRLEAVSGKNAASAYPFNLTSGPPPWRISFAPVIRRIVGEAEVGAPAAKIGSKFHSTLAGAIAAAAQKCRETFGIDTAALVGGVFLNRVLLERTTARLSQLKFTVLRPEQYSPNDESISLGQIAYALAKLKNLKK